LNTLAALVTVYAAFLGGVHAVVTRPVRRKLNTIHGRVLAVLRAEFAALRADLRAMETRLNDRIESRIIRA
jgi:hypothetical protein